MSVFDYVYLIHFYKPVVGSGHKFMLIFRLFCTQINMNDKRNFFFLHEIFHSFTFIYSFVVSKRFYKLVREIFWLLNDLTLFFFFCFILVCRDLIRLIIHKCFQSSFWMEVFKQLSRSLSKLSHVNFIS